MSAFAHDVAEIFADAVGDEELGVFGPAIGVLGELNFFFAEGFAVSLFGVVPVRGAETDVAVDDDDFRAVGDAERVSVGVGERNQIVGIMDVLNIPAIGGEAGGHIFVIREIGIAFDGDVVVVVDPAEV